ncbi:MAG: DUF5791 family protein [Halobacteriales archaeon]
MFHTAVDTPGDHPPQEVYETHLRKLAEVIDAVGIDRVVAETGLDQSTVKTIAAIDVESDGSSVPTLDLADAAAILALKEGMPDAETILDEDRTHLLMGMSTAVLDVDTIAVEIDIPLDPKEIQAKLEGRHPMTLKEFAVLQQFIAARGAR